MTVYNLNYSKLESLLDRSFSPGTENAIIEAIKSAGIVNPWSGKIGVDVVDTSGAQTLPSGVQILLDTGANNDITVKTHGATLIAAGDGSVKVVDKGPGGDTLVGGAGSESLKVTHGENVLIAGSGENTLIGGAGHDTLIGGGSSLLEAGAGGSTLIGGNFDQSSRGGSPRGSRSWARTRTRRDDGSHGSAQFGSGPTPSDTLMGGQGSDLLQVSHGDNLLVAGAGHDTIFGGDGHDTILGGGPRHDQHQLRQRIRAGRRRLRRRQCRPARERRDLRRPRDHDSDGPDLEFNQERGRAYTGSQRSNSAIIKSSPSAMSRSTSPTATRRSCTDRRSQARPGARVTPAPGRVEGAGTSTSPSFIERRTGDRGLRFR